NSSWYSVWGPFGDLHTVESIGIAMEYPLNRPTIELRNVHLATNDEGSEFLETAPVLDGFKQWALADWPRKIKSQEQLTQELAAEEKAFGSAADFGYGKYGGYKNTQARATGFFRVEKIDGRWWFVDPEGHLFLSTGTNGSPGGGAGFGGNDAGAAADTQCTPRKNDPLVLGYFIGNEPPWNAREGELCGLILGGPATATQARL